MICGEPGRSSGAGASSLWAHGYIGDCNGPNSNEPLADDMWACNFVKAAVGGTASLLMLKMGCFDGTIRQSTARSCHVGGINAVFCDGSVHFISDLIDVSGDRSRYPPYSVWDRLNLSCDGEPISADAF